MRQEFSRKTKRQILDRANGHCEGKHCHAVLKTGEGEYDHKLPCALGGDNSAENGQLLCNICHKIKTVTDIKQARKADRARDKQSGALAPKQTIKSKGFPKTRKKSQFDRSSPPFKSLFKDAS